MVTVVDAGTGNLRSLGNALDAVGVEFRIRLDPPAGPDSTVVLPGVGAFGHAMQELERRGWAEHLRHALREGSRILGICVGMQLLFERSEESPGVAGLGFLPGNVARLDARTAKVPHISWERLRFTPDEPDGPRPAWAYFVHSYVARPQSGQVVTAWAGHGTEHFPAVVRDGNVTGVQFHPEKSQGPGLAYLHFLITGGQR